MIKHYKLDNKKMQRQRKIKFYYYCDSNISKYVSSSLKMKSTTKKNERDLKKSSILHHDVESTKN